MHFCRFRFLSVPLLAALVLAGCKPQPAASKDRVPPNPNAPALYGPPTGTASKEIPRALPHSRDTSWQSAPFYVLHTELSPAILVHSSTRYLGLFSDLAELELGAPSHVAWSTKDGPRAFKAGETQDSTGMEENWLLVWFAGATNWTNWDSPWAVFLQHKPGWIRLDAGGLHLEFPASAGDVVMMPLYGYFKLPPAGRDYLAEHGMKSRRLNSWEWDQALARDPLTRLRFWAGASREFPFYCEDSFSVDRAHDELTIRSRFEWHSIDDDWKTKHVKLAPISPALGLAAKDKEFPVRFSKPFFDMELPTPFGPYFGIQDVDSFDATFSVLQYVNETEAFQAPDTNAHPTVAQALGKLREAAIQFTETGRVIANAQYGSVTWVSRVRTAQAMLALAAPYMNEAEGLRLESALRAHLTNDAILRDWHSVHPEWPISPGTLAAWRNYAELTGDWESATNVWTALRDKLQFDPPRAWITFGDAVVFGSEILAAQHIAAARLAYKAGDMDGCDYACLRTVQTLTHVWAMQRGADYFRTQQPWHSMEWMGEEVFLTDASQAGWLLDGPNFPKDAQVRGFDQRWSQPSDADTGRFVADWLRGDVRRELNWRQARRGKVGSAEEIASQVTARSILLNESAAELAAVGRPEQFGGTSAEVLSACLAVLRASRPVRYERLIPPGEPTRFVAGSERDARESARVFVASVEFGGDAARDLRWPCLVWPQWKSPRAGAWSFGRITPVRDGLPAAVQRKTLNWNTVVITYAMP